MDLKLTDKKNISSNPNYLDYIDAAKKGFAYTVLLTMVSLCYALVLYLIGLELQNYG